MPKKYTPNLDEIKRCWGLKVDTHKRPEREAEFDRVIAKVKADAVRDAADEVLKHNLDYELHRIMYRLATDLEADHE